MQIYLTVRPEDTQEASALRKGLAHNSYRIGEDGALLCRSLLVQTRGGLLVLTDQDAPALNRPEQLASAILRECGRREYSGVVLDFEQPPRQDLRQLAAALSRRLAETRRALFLPEAYASAAEQRIVLVNTAVSGGSFAQHIQESVSRYGGPQKVALDIQRLRMEFQLPAKSGEGTPLTEEALSALRQEVQPAVFFSSDLCARYFTCTRQETPRFILFDDAGTLRQKLRLGQQLGLAAAFFQWPEIRDLAPALFRRG